MKLFNVDMSKKYIIGSINGLVHLIFGVSQMKNETYQ